MDSSIITAIKTIQEAMIEATEKMISDHIIMIVRDLARHDGDGLTVKINIPIQANVARIFMEPTIEWKRKYKQKFDAQPVKIDLLQSEIDFSSPGQS